MAGPDQLLFEADLQSAAFRAGVLAERWSMAEPTAQPDHMGWPQSILWLAAAARSSAPCRFYLTLNLEGYRTVPPSGTFWNPVKRGLLEPTLRPRGKDGSRFARVFRTDWENGSAFYHPYDRKAQQSHPEWVKDLPKLVWNSRLTIVDWLEEFQALFFSEDYLGLAAS